MYVCYCSEFVRSNLLKHSHSNLRILLEQGTKFHPDLNPPSTGMYVNSQLNPTQNRYPSNPKQHDYYDESLLGTHKVGSLTH